MAEPVPLPVLTPARLRPGTTLALLGAAIDLALAAGIGVIRATNGSFGERHAEGPLPTLAIVAALAAPGVLALIGIAIRRPVLFGAAGIACAPMVFVSIVAFPLLVPCVLLIVAFTQAPPARGSHPPMTGLIVGGFFVPLMVGLWILITRTAQYTYSLAGGSEGGDYFTPGHARLCIALVLADVAIVSILAWRSQPVSARTSPSACGS